MKKFLKLNKYNLLMGLLGGVAYPILVYLLQKVEPSGYIGWIISIILVVLSYIVSVIPSAFISLMQILTRYQPELVNDEKEVHYNIYSHSSFQLHLFLSPRILV